MTNNDGFVTKNLQEDELARLLKEPRPSTRHDIWLWLYLYDFERAKLNPDTCNGAAMRDDIAHFLKRNTDLLDEINRQKDRFMVKDDYLKWIDGGERQYRWLLNRIEGITASGLPRGLVHLTGKKRLIAMLDHWDVAITKKVEEIERLRRDWLQRKARDSDFSVFEDKKDGASRCKCAWEWLEKNYKNLPEKQLPISNYTELLIFFDQENLSAIEQKHFIQKINKHWNRQQYDKRTPDKKQFNVKLSLTAINLLSELAQKHDLTQARVLELLITMESERGMIEKHFTRHASKDIAAESDNSTPTQPARTQMTIDKSPAALLAPQTQPTLEAKREPSSAFMSDSATPVIDHPVSENLEAQPNKNASSHFETDRPPLSIQATTQCPPSRGERPKTLGDILREKEEEESRRLKAEIGPV